RLRRLREAERCEAREREQCNERRDREQTERAERRRAGNRLCSGAVAPAVAAREGRAADDQERERSHDEEEARAVQQVEHLARSRNVDPQAAYELTLAGPEGVHEIVVVALESVVAVRNADDAVKNDVAAELHVAVRDDLADVVAARALHDRKV